jgi:signal transduction histidine kinase
MDLTVPDIATSELAAAFFQAIVTTGLAVLFVGLLFRYRKAHFAYWAMAWSMYSFRLACILSFLLTAERFWLYWHQVATGWTALALLWAALVFSMQVRWRNRYLALVLFPPVWSYLAIYRLESFALAAWPAVLFLSLATFWTGGVFLRYARTVRSSAGAFLGIILVLWGIHDLDYPLLRAMGAWNPWGYYLDLLFELGVGIGILLVVLEDQRRGLEVFSEVSEDLQMGVRGGDVLDGLVARPLTLPGVQGSAIFRQGPSGPEFVKVAGICAEWVGSDLAPPVRKALARALDRGRPHLERGGRILGRGSRKVSYVVAFPVLRGKEIAGAMVVAGLARDPLAALDERFLLALGRQVGAAMETADLYRQLQDRSRDLERLAARMVTLHEEERRRLARELHDETAQVFAAVKIELGALQETVDESSRPRLDRAVGLVGTGIQSIRDVTRGLRPTILDDLGLLPALRALVADFKGGDGRRVRFEAPSSIPELPEETELALFRALQEGLANVVRHAGASLIDVSITHGDGWVTLEVTDDGVGIEPHRAAPGDGLVGGMGLTGMRERITRLGGQVRLSNREGGGTVLSVSVPVKEEQ